MGMNIICTINNAWTSKDIEEMTNNGLTNFRINGVHLSEENIKKYIKIIKNNSRKNKIYFDLPGRKARLWYNKERTKVKKGSVFNIYCGTMHQKRNIYMTGGEEFASAKEHDLFCIRRNQQENVYLEVLEKNVNEMIVKVQNDGVLGWGYQIYNISNREVGKGIARDDEYYIELLRGENVDYVVVSFVDNEDMFLKYKKRLLGVNSGIEVYAKIETKEGMQNAEAILKECSGMVVGRDDMSMFFNSLEIQDNLDYLIELGKKNSKIVIPASNYFTSLPNKGGLDIEEIQNLKDLKSKGITKIYCNETTKYKDWKELARVQKIIY